MYTQAILTAAAILCMFSHHVLVVDANNVTAPAQLVQIKDIICAIVLSGGLVERVDRDTVDQLQKFNISLGNLNKTQAVRDMCKTSAVRVGSSLGVIDTKNNNSVQYAAAVTVKAEKKLEEPGGSNLVPTIINLVTITNNEGSNNVKGRTQSGVIDLQNNTLFYIGNEKEVLRQPNSEYNLTLNKIVNTFQSEPDESENENALDDKIAKERIELESREKELKFETIIKEIGKVLTEDEIKRIKVYIWNGSMPETFSKQTTYGVKHSINEEFSEKICNDDKKCKSESKHNHIGLKKNQKIANPENYEKIDLALKRGSKNVSFQKELENDALLQQSEEYSHKNSQLISSIEAEGFFDGHSDREINYIIEKTKKEILRLVQSRQKQQHASKSYKREPYKVHSIKEQPVQQNSIQHVTTHLTGQARHLPSYVHAIPQKDKMLRNHEAEQYTNFQKLLQGKRYLIDLNVKEAIEIKYNNATEKYDHEEQEKNQIQKQKALEAITKEKQSNPLTAVDIQDIVNQVKATILNDLIKPTTTTEVPPTLTRKENTKRKNKLKHENSSDRNIVIPPLSADAVAGMINFLNQNFKNASPIREKNILIQDIAPIRNVTHSYAPNNLNVPRSQDNQNESPGPLPIPMQQDVNMLAPLQIPVNINSPYGLPNTFGSQNIYRNPNFVQVSSASTNRPRANNKVVRGYPHESINDQYEQYNDRRIFNNMKTAESQHTVDIKNLEDQQTFHDTKTMEDPEANHYRRLNGRGDEEYQMKRYNFKKDCESEKKRPISDTLRHEKLYNRGKHDMRSSLERQTSNDATNSKDIKLYERESSIHRTAMNEENFNNNRYEGGRSNRELLRRNESKETRAPAYHDTHFQNFLKTQEKVNNVLERLLAKTKQTKVYVEA